MSQENRTKLTRVDVSRLRIAKTNLYFIISDLVAIPDERNPNRGQPRQEAKQATLDQWKKKFDETMTEVFKPLYIKPGKNQKN